MSLPVEPPLSPMEAETREQLPAGEWQYEPKWDGFRCIAFRDEQEVRLQSKNGLMLARYFPDVAAGIARARARRFVLDGELVIPVDGRLVFDQLQLRLHPAASRVRKLAAEHPAALVVFDLLVDERGRDHRGQPLQRRRQALERFAGSYFEEAPLFLSPATRDRELAQAWMHAGGTDLDGVVAKRLDSTYRAGERAMVKVKRIRSADCVVGGFRYGERTGVVGSLLLGLYDGAGLLHHVGFTSGFSRTARRELTQMLEQMIEEPGFTGARPGAPSRWSRGRSTEWVPVAPRVAVEVAYDHFTGGRFRHGTRFLRFRPDKSPRQCTLEQVASPGAAVSMLEGAAGPEPG